MDCKYCNKKLNRKTWCDSCNKPQIEANDVSWTDKTCRRCYSQGVTVLDEFNPYCGICKVEMRALEQEKTIQEKEASVGEKSARTSHRWLNAWFTWTYEPVEDQSFGVLTFIWEPPEFLRKKAPNIDSYNIHSADFEYLHTTDAGLEFYVIQDFPKDTVLDFFLSVLIKEEGWLETEKKQIKYLKTKVKT